MGKTYTAEAEEVLGRDLSASQIKEHRTCPMQYWFDYISGHDPSKKEMKYLNLGSAVHEAIEQALKMYGLHSVEEDELVYLYEEQAEHFGVPEDVYDDGITCAKTAVRWLAKNSDAELRDIEKRLKFTIDKEDYRERLTAIMDVATDSEIWDWKTGSIRDGIGAEEKIQGMVYAGAYHAHYGEYPEKVRFIYLKEEEVRSIEPNDENWRFMLEHLRALHQDREAGEFEAKPGGHCYWCDWEFYCPASGAGAGELDWEDYRA